VLLMLLPQFCLFTSDMTPLAWSQIVYMINSEMSSPYAAKVTTWLRASAAALCFVGLLVVCA
jgi:hypothetical protein